MAGLPQLPHKRPYHHHNQKPNATFSPCLCMTIWLLVGCAEVVERGSATGKFNNDNTMVTPEQEPDMEAINLRPLGVCVVDRW